MGLHGDDVHPGLVKRRANQVVHRGVDDGEILVRGVLEVLDPGQQYAGVGDDRTARFEHQRQCATLHALAHRGDVVAGQRRLLVAIAHAEAATQVQVANGDALFGQPVDEGEQAVQCVEERGQAGQLRADMAVHADHLEVRQVGGAGVYRRGLLDVDAELVFLQAG